MLKRHFILIGIILSIVFICIASQNYPGGTPKNSQTIGYSWTENYISNLLSVKALNGMNNDARPWAIIGSFFYNLTFGLFFVDFSKKIILKSIKNVIKYLGIVLTGLSFFIVVPNFHDIVVTIASVLNLIVFFYITILILKSKLNVFKILSIFFLLTFYFACYMYFTRSYIEYMPIMQKAIHVFQIIWILGLHYFTTKKDFENITK